jgi:hypothetical protein
MPALYERIRVTLEPPFTALLLLTDGVTDPKFETEAMLWRPEPWNALWEEIGRAVQSAGPEQAGAEMLEWLGFWSPGHHDDRSVAVLAEGPDG